MSNLITDWRAELVAHLETAFPTAEVLSGERADSVSRDKDRICVFWPGMGEASNVNYAQPRMMIRYWKKFAKTTLKPVPRDDGPLEQAAWDLATSLQPVQTTIDQANGNRFYFQVVQILPVRDEYAVEAQLVAWTKNPAAIATP